MDAQQTGQSAPADADAALRQTLADVLSGGDALGAGGDASVDLQNYQVSVAEPLARVVTNPARKLDTTAAVARFVWMAAGNDRLADIAFYVPQVRTYTDDGLTVPGSSYGQRLRRPSPGLDQLPGVVERLRVQSDTRRAAAVIWCPEDAVRTSGDIPCAFGVFYRVLDGRLNATTVMRSNNAFRLLPFNLFEFTMLAELVAGELGVDMGEYTHWAASMHVLEQGNELARARALVGGPASSSAVMPPMPRDSSPLEAVRLLAVAEAELRHAPGPSAVADLRGRIARELGPYWTALFDTLAVWVLRGQGAADDADALMLGIPEYLAAGIKAAPPEPAGDGQLTLLEVPTRGGSARRLPVQGGPDRDEVAAALDRVAVRHEQATGETVTRPEYAAVLDELLALPGGYGLAARSDGGADANADDRFMTVGEFGQRIRARRGR